MAAIDKIYLNKKQIPAFFEFLKNVDNDFKKVFINCESVLDWTYYECYYDTSGELLPMNDFTKNETAPVSNFPTLVDKFLYQHPATPAFIKDYLRKQYGGSDEELTEPLKTSDEREYSGKFRITERVKYEGKLFNAAPTYWTLSVGDCMCWFPDLKKFIPYDHTSPEYLGLDWWFGSSSYRFGSLKAVYRFIRKHRFPVGTEIRICDARYVVSEVVLKIVSEK